MVSFKTQIYEEFLGGPSDGEGLSELYLELVDAYRIRFMPQNGQAAVLKCSPIWKKMRKSFKTSELKDTVMWII